MQPGERFKEVRGDLKLTQQELGDKLGFKQYKIKDIETNKLKVTSDIAAEMEKLFNVSGWWLLTGNGEKYAARLPLGEDKTYHVSEERKQAMQYVEEAQTTYGKPLPPDIQSIEEVLVDLPTEKRREVLRYALNIEAELNGKA